MIPDQNVVPASGLPPVGGTPVSPAPTPVAVASTTMSLNALEASVPTPTKPKPTNQEFGAYAKENFKAVTPSLGEKAAMNISTATSLMGIFGLIGVIFFSLAKINVRSDTKDIDYASIVAQYKSIVMDVDDVVGYPGINAQKNMLAIVTDANLTATATSSIPFIFKKDMLEETAANMAISIMQKNMRLQEVKKDVNKYGFIHPEIMSILEKSKDQIPIMISLHTLETIKFGTALKIFSLLDTFLQQAAYTLGLSKDGLVGIMSEYTTRGEKDIAQYLSTCYLNPYEKMPDCSQIDDFSNYFLYTDTTSKIDTAVFAKLMSLIDVKLEKSDISSLQIEFNRFDPNLKNIGFRVVVNTLAEDDSAFMRRGILNPHVFIISTLVTLLKQSFFVIGDSINVDRLNIKEQNITVGGIQIPISTSSMTFDLPLQNSAEREITDFYAPTVVE